MSGKNPYNTNGRKPLYQGSLPTTAAVSGLAGIVFSVVTASGAIAADQAPLTIKGVQLDTSKQLVVEFATHQGSFPSVPHLLDLPGPNHRIVLDFADTVIDKVTMQSPEELTTQFAKASTAIKGVRYSALTNTPKPTARLVLDLPEEVKAQPRVVKLDESSVTISLGDQAATKATNDAPQPAIAAPSAEASAPALASTGGLTAADATLSDGNAASAGNALTVNQPAETTNSGVQPLPGSNTPSILANGTPATASNWDWSGSANNPTATPSEIKEPTQAAAPAQAAAPEADNIDGVAPTATEPSGTELKTSQATPTPIPTEAAQAPVPAVSPATDALVGAAEPGAATSAPAAQASELPAQLAPVASAPVAGAGSEGGSPVQSAVHLYNRAVRNHLTGKLQEAIADYKAALAANSSLAEAHSNLGLIYNQQHDYGQALSEFRKALAISPKDAITYNGIGAALRAEHDLVGAIKNWQTAVSLDPHLATAHYNLGTAYELQKDPDRALAAYKQAVKNDYRLGEAYYRMGLIMERKHQLDDAATQFKEALNASNTSDYCEDARQRLAYLQKDVKR